MLQYSRENRLNLRGGIHLTPREKESDTLPENGMCEE